MTTANRCEAKCGRPARGGIICPDCTRQLRTDLHAVPGLRRELEAAFSRQVAMGRSVGGRSSERPMAYGVAAADALRVLDRALLAAHRWLDPFGIDGPADDAAYLLGRLEEVRQHDTAPTIVRRIHAAVSAARVVIDSPADRWYAGACGFDGEGRPVDPDGLVIACTEELYVEVGEPYVDCRCCGERWDVQARRNRLQSIAAEQLAHASMLAAALTYLDREVPAATVRSWVRRHRLVAVDVDVKGRPLYRVGDALDLISAAEVKAALRLDTPEMLETSTSLDKRSTSMQHSECPEKGDPENSVRSS